MTTIHPTEICTALGILNLTSFAGTPFAINSDLVMSAEHRPNPAPHKSADHQNTGNTSKRPTRTPKTIQPYKLNFDLNFKCLPRM